MQTPAYTVEHKNEAGYYEARWSEKVEATGKYRSRRWSTGRTDLREARAAAEHYFKGLGVVSAAAKMATVQEIVDLYLEAAESRQMGDTNRFALRVILRHFGSYTPAQITAAVVKDYVKDRRDDGIKNGTIRRDLGALVAALNYGMRVRLLTAADMPFVDLPPDSPPRDIWLDEAQEAEFYQLALADSHGKKRLTRLTRFVAIALDTAARTGAIEGLTWDRVDFKAGVIDFREPGRRITKKLRVTVPISSRLRPVLEQAFAERVGVYVIDRGDIKKCWGTFVASTPYPHIHKHDLRRTWATLAARAGVDLFQIAGVLGDDIKTVMKHYAKHQPGHLRAAVDARFKAA